MGVTLNDMCHLRMLLLPSVMEVAPSSPQILVYAFNVRIFKDKGDHQVSKEREMCLF